MFSIRLQFTTSIEEIIRIRNPNQEQLENNSMFISMLSEKTRQLRSAANYFSFRDLCLTVMCTNKHNEWHQQYETYTKTNGRT